MNEIETKEQATAGEKLEAAGASASEVEDLVRMGAAKVVLDGLLPEATKSQTREAVAFARWSLSYERGGSGLDWTIQEFKVERQGAEDVSVFLKVGLREEKGFDFLASRPRMIFVSPRGGARTTRPAYRGGGRVKVSGRASWWISGDAFRSNAK